MRKDTCLRTEGDHPWEASDLLGTVVEDLDVVDQNRNPQVEARHLIHRLL